MWPSISTKFSNRFHSSIPVLDRNCHFWHITSVYKPFYKKKGTMLALWNKDISLLMLPAPRSCLFLILSFWYQRRAASAAAAAPDGWWYTGLSRAYIWISMQNIYPSAIFFKEWLYIKGYPFHSSSTPTSSSSKAYYNDPIPKFGSFQGWL